MHVMIDLETLGTRPDAAILQIGAVAFEKRSGGRVYDTKAFNRFVMLQDGAGTIDHGTFKFWMEQNNPDMRKGLGEAIPLMTALDDLINWPATEDLGFTWGNVEGIWAKGSDFDLPILRSAFARFGSEAPWPFRASRCVRTFLAEHPKIQVRGMEGLQAHDAVSDCLWQIAEIQQTMQSLAQA